MKAGAAGRTQTANGPRVIVLGDSSSSGLGSERCHYPQLLQQHLPGASVSNYSVPGLTAADARALYQSELRRAGCSNLVLYLGNNEAALGSYRRRRPFWLRRLLQILRFRADSAWVWPPEKFLLQPEHQQANFQPAGAGRFRRDITAIIRAARAEGTQVVIINPVANKLFPAGAGLLNAPFFEFLGWPARVAHLLHASDPWGELLIEGIGAREQNDFSRMRDCFRRLQQECPLSMYSTIALNNEACALAGLEPEHAESLLRKGQESAWEYECIFHYNLARLYESLGRKGQAQNESELSCETDRSLYRIQDPYRACLAELASEFRLPLVDLAELLSPDDFVDYCHPTARGHAKIAHALQQVISAGVPTTTCAKPCEDLFPSPAYYSYPRTTIVEYYGIEQPVERERLATLLRSIISALSFEEFEDPACIRRRLFAHSSSDTLQRYVLNFLVSNSGHPIFNDKLDLLGAHLPLAHEIFTFPEFFLYRLLYNYAAGLESEAGGTPGPLTAEQYAALILRKNKLPLDAPICESKEYAAAVAGKLRRCLMSSSIFENRIGVRAKTIMYWYTREAFRYGTHSRLSMLYDRVPLDWFSESLLVLSLISLRRNLCLEDNIEEVRSGLAALAEIHDGYCSNFLKKGVIDAAEYEDALKSRRLSLIAAVDMLIRVLA